MSSYQDKRQILHLVFRLLSFGISRNFAGQRVYLMAQRLQFVLCIPLICDGPGVIFSSSPKACAYTGVSGATGLYDYLAPYGDRATTLCIHAIIEGLMALGIVPIREL